jgi:diacylglycerol kinase (ATP)
MRTCVILNPEAGSGNSAARVQRAMARLPNAELRESDAPASLELLVRQAVADGYQRIVAAGGDGTVSAVASALLAAGEGQPGYECGILPIGTGNDLALALGIPLELEKAAEILSSGSASKVDVIECRAVERVGVSPLESQAWNAIVGGFGGSVSKHLTTAQKRRWRRFSYLRAALSELREMSPHRVRVEIDGTPHDMDLLMLVIANGSQAGGGIPLAPESRVDDGALDVVGIRAQNLSALLRTVPRVLAGNHLGEPGVFHARGRSVRVESDRGMHYNRDGEAWESGGAEFEVHPDALSFVRP